MKLKYWMIAKAVVCLVFGVLFLVVPGPVMGLYDLKLDDVSTYFIRLLGSAFTVLAIFLWLMRGAESPANRRSICVAVFVGDLIGFVVALLGQLGGVPNALGWVNVVLYLVLALGFGYFLLPQKA
jgi:hypothetical protein